jgi:mRNA capping enzyme, catalytic domain
MLYIAHSGTYLIDRKLTVARVQMRFPLWTRDGVATETSEDMVRWLLLFDAGKLPKPTRVSASQMQFHHGTLLDGEMVVNEDKDGHQERVFYAYDLMMLHGANVTARPWKVRTCAFAAAAGHAMP